MQQRLKKSIALSLCTELLIYLTNVQQTIVYWLFFFGWLTSPKHQIRLIQGASPILKVKIGIYSHAQFKNILDSTITSEVQRPLPATSFIFSHIQENISWLLQVTICIAATLRTPSRRSEPDGRRHFGIKKKVAAASLRHFSVKQETAIVCEEKMTGNTGKDQANLSA